MLLGAGVRRQVRDAAWVQVYAGSILLNAYAAHSRQKPVDVCRADARTWLHISGSGCLQLRWHLRVPSGAKACDGKKLLVVAKALTQIVRPYLLWEELHCQRLAHRLLWPARQAQTRSGRR